MLNKLFTLPKEIWITYTIFEETVIERATILEATYDKFGYKTLYFQTVTGNLHVWDRKYLSETDLFETKQQAIDSVKNGIYSIHKE